MKLLDLHPTVRGLAVWDGHHWRFGAEALASCRVDPLATCWDVWEALSLIPLAVNRDGVRHRADLAVNMLREDGLKSGEPQVALVPSGWSKEQMRVFLGAASAAKLSVRWLTSREGMMVSRMNPEGDSCSVLDWSWGQLQQVNFMREKGEWRLGEVRGIADGGILACFRREALAVQDLALEKFRYDPLYSGRTEQALFSGWWAALREGTAWSVTAPDGSKIALSEQRERFAVLHRNVMTGLEDREDVLAPVALSRMLGWRHALPEPKLSGLEVAVEDHDAASARWRIPLEGAEKPTARRATHVVVDGMAEPWSGNAAPGETVILPDGRSALAVFVRETYGEA